jgi:regulator of CtrA degradation
VSAQSTSETAAPVAFFDRTYAEALALTRAARDYIATQAPSDKAALDPDTRLVASCEEMRVTARLTQVMAWLMTQRAVHDGDLTREDAATEAYRLGARETCLAEPALPTEALPDRLADLLRQSRDLYGRIERLDRNLDAAAPPDA